MLEVCFVVESLMYEVLESYLEFNFVDVKLIVEKIIFVVCVCEVVWKVCEVSYNKSGLSIKCLDKFVDCYEKDFVYLEIYFVEGDFVGGLVKFGCNLDY